MIISSQSDHCRVIGGVKLPAHSGGAQALCQAVEVAAKGQAPRASFVVEVRVLSTSALVAAIRMKDGRVLPEQNMAVSDGTLDRKSIKRFAAAIAAQIAQAGLR